MKRVIKENDKKMRNQSKCYLLRQLKSMKIGANDVEHTVRRITASDHFKTQTKLKMMRQKIAGAYELLRQSQSACNTA